MEKQNAGEGVALGAWNAFGKFQHPAHMGADWRTLEREAGHSPLLQTTCPLLACPVLAPLPRKEKAALLNLQTTVI